MGYLGIRGNADRCDEVMQALKNLGGEDTGNWSGTDPNKIYYINPMTNFIDTHSLIVFDKYDVEEINKYWKMTIEDFNSQFPFKENDIVELKSDNNPLLPKSRYIIVSLRWDHVTDEVEYGLAEFVPDMVFDKPEIFRNADEIQYYQEPDICLKITDPQLIAKAFVLSLKDFRVEIEGDEIRIIKK